MNSLIITLRTLVNKILRYKGKKGQIDQIFISLLLFGFQYFSEVKSS